MLINCPRCGFSQPQDQYCAQCGIDMQSYKPKELPFFKKLVSSTGFQLGVLILVTVIAAQFILKRYSPQKFSQKNSRSQGVFKSEQNRDSANEDEDENYADTSSVNDRSDSRPLASVGSDSVESASLSDRAQQAARGNLNGAETSGANANGANGVGSASEQDAQFFGKLRVIYAEVPIDIINKWITDSSNLALYQSLSDYSVGILPEFKKRNETFQVLKTYEVEFKPQATSNTNISGIVSDETNQLIGFSTVVERTGRLNDGTLVGQINVSKRGRVESDSYPSEFELPKGSAFFLIGALKIENFQSDRAKLQMPPFQIFKSNDFMTRKTEFVIIVEPDYK
jgi:hypothetical protein